MTPDELCDAWKSSFLKSATHVNGWVFRLGTFNDETKTGPIRMFIDFDKCTVETRTKTKINIGYVNFDSLFYKDGPFWNHSGIKFIDFNCCFVKDLVEFLSWCETHSPLEIINLI